MTKGQLSIKTGALKLKYMRKCWSVFIVSSCYLSLISCDSAIPKSLDGRDWTEFGIYEVFEDVGVNTEDNSGQEVIAGETTAGDIAGAQVTAGEQQAGAEMAGAEMAGAEMAGAEMAGAEMAGDDIIEIREDPLVEFTDGIVPTSDQVGFWDQGDQVSLWWAKEQQIWMSRSDSSGELGTPRLVFEHTDPINRISISVLAQRTVLIFEDTNTQVLILIIDEEDVSLGHTFEPQVLPFAPQVRISTFEDQLLIVGMSSQSSHLIWMALSASDLISASISVEEIALFYDSSVSWPIPDAIGWVSGQAVLRFDDVGQCLYLTPRFNVAGSTPCIPSKGNFLSALSESVMLLLDETGTLKATTANAPNLESSYLIAQLQLADDIEGKVNPVFGPFLSSTRRSVFLGRPFDDDTDEGLLDRLIVAEPLGLWMSDLKWAEWPYPNTKAITRRQREAWVYVFDAQYQPRRISVPLQVNKFVERTPFGLTHDPNCRPTVERCDEVDNNCDGVVDNGLCCATGRSPYEGYFIPSAPPREFFVTDVENADASRYAVRVGDDRWEIWAIYYGASSRNLVSFGTIEGAHDALGFTAAGGYSVLVAKDADGAWRAFWNHSDSNASLKEPELLNCDRALAMSNVGNLATSSSPAVVCNDRVIHLRADRDAEDVLLPIETHLGPFSTLPEPEWATFIRHSSRGESSFNIAFRSLAGESWEVNKVSVSKGVGGRLSFGVPQSLNGRLDIDGQVRPNPIYLHRDDSPGFPGALPYLQINDDRNAAQINIPRESGRKWTPVVFGRSVDRIDYTELPSKLVASAEHEDGLAHDFYIMDVKNYDSLSPWVTKPTFTWQTPRLDDEESPTEPVPILWSLIHGNYYNYIATLFEAGDQTDDGASLPRGVWALRLYSVTQCPQ
jgi:hypothetical protein